MKNSLTSLLLLSTLLLPLIAVAEDAPPPVDRTAQAITASKTPEFPAFGSPTAPLTMVIFQDMHCGMCAWFFTQNFVQLKENYIEAGIVRLIIAPYPLLRSEKGDKVEYAALCAHAQNSYILFLANYYNNRKTYDAEKIPAYAKGLILDESKLTTCMASDETKSILSKAREIGENPLIDGTPTILLNGKEIGGAMPWPVLERELQQEMARLRK